MSLAAKQATRKQPGNTLVTYAKNDNTYLVAVVMQSVNGAYSDTKALLDYGFNNFSRSKIKGLKKEISRSCLPAEKYLLKDYKDFTLFRRRQNAYVSLPQGTDVSQLSTSYSMTKNLAGLPLLTVTYSYNGHDVGTADITRHGSSQTNFSDCRLVCLFLRRESRFSRISSAFSSSILFNVLIA